MTQLEIERMTELVATHVDPLTRDRLLALARQEDRSVSWVLRRALGRELERDDNEEMEVTP